MRTVSAALALSFAVGCGAGAVAPTPTAAPAAATVAAVPAPSPQRPPLASPVSSPAAVAPPAATSVPPTVEVAGQTYEVQSGDTLLSIARDQLGDATQWRRIYDANKDTIGADPDKLKLGMTLKMPPKATPTP